MFSNLHGLELIAANLIAMLLWNMIIFVLSVRIDQSHFDPSKPMYREKAWEKSGKIYVKKFKIKKWKDILPQHIGRNGFSKKNLKNLSTISKDYIEQFITETCRAEWNHWMCCLFYIISMFANSFFNGIIFGTLSIAFNFPYVIIQRYNRIRLNSLLKRSKGVSKGVNYKAANA